MKKRMVEIGNAIMKFLETVEGCEDYKFSTRFMNDGDPATIEFKWREHFFLMLLGQSGGGILISETAKHEHHYDSEVAGDIADVPMDAVMALDGVGPIGRVPSQCSIDIQYITKGAGKHGRDKYERVIRLENPDEVHLLPSECVQKLDEILLKDVTNFLRWHFRAWEDGGINLKHLYHPRACY
jgi:hypothetical protein